MLQTNPTSISDEIKANDIYDDDPEVFRNLEDGIKHTVFVRSNKVYINIRDQTKTQYTAKQFEQLYSGETEIVGYDSKGKPIIKKLGTAIVESATNVDPKKRLRTLEYIIPRPELAPMISATCDGNPEFVFEEDGLLYGNSYERQKIRGLLNCKNRVSFNDDNAIMLKIKRFIQLIQFLMGEYNFDEREQETFKKRREGFSEREVEKVLNPPIFNELKDSPRTIRFLKYLADKMQNPAERASFMMVLIGKTQCTGKSMLTTIIGRVFNMRSLSWWKVIKKHNGFNGFNAYLSGTDFLCVSVAPFVDKHEWDKKINSRLTEAVTRKKIDIKRKWKKTVEENLYYNLILESNHIDTLHITEKDLAYEVYNCNPTVPLNIDFYEAVANDIKDPSTLEAFRFFLAKMDLSGYNRDERILTEDAIKMYGMYRLMKSPLKTLIQEIIDKDGYTGLPTSVFTKLINVSDINHNNYNETQVGRVLNQMLGGNISKKYTYKQGLKTVRILDPNKKECDWKELIKTKKLQEDLDLAELRIKELSSKQEANGK